MQLHWRNLPDGNRHDLPSEFFSSVAIDDDRPLLHPTVIRKLTKYIGQVARPTKRIKSSVHDSTPGSVGSPRGKGRIAAVDTATLSRMFKILERSVKAGEVLDPFTTTSVDKKVTAARKSSTFKRSTKLEKTCMSQSPKGMECDPGIIGEDSATPELTDVDLGVLAESLDVARDSILAADCCIALLGSDGLTKQVC
jgi:cohesin loading factor subunit SCC2